MNLKSGVWLTAIVRRRGFVLGFWVALTSLTAPGLSLLRFDNSPKVFFVREADALERYRQFELDFGRDWVVRLAAAGPGLWSEPGLRWLGEAERTAASLDGAVGAAGLYSHHISQEDRWPPPDPDAFGRRVVDNSLDRNAGWVGRRGDTASILVALYNLDSQQLESLLDRLEKTAKEAPTGIETWTVGLPLFQQAMDEELVKFFVRFFPLLGVTATLVLLLVLRRPAHILPPLLLVAVCMTVLFGSMGYLGISLNFILMIAAPLVFVIALATAVHILARFRYFRQQGQNRSSAVASAYREKAWPVFWTGVTTGVGFGALVTSTAPPVRMLGACTAAGIALLMLAAFTFYPALLALGRQGPVLTAQPAPLPLERWARRNGRRWAQWAHRKRRLVFAVFAAAALFCLPGLGRLRTETSVLSYFPKGHPLRDGVERLQEAGIAAVSAELMLSGESGTAPFQPPSQFLKLADLSGRLRSLPRVLGAVGLGDLMEDVLRRGAAATPDEAFQRLAEAPPETRLLPYFWTRDGRRARVSLLIPLLGHQQLEPVLEAARRTAEAMFPDLEAAVTGRYPLVLAAQRRLLETMIASLSITLLAVAGVFGFLLRRPKLWVAALAPNLWAVLFVLGAMGWAGIPLDSTTIMIASVVLGLAVDDTLHTFGHFRRLKAGRNSAEAAAATMEEIAGAHMLSTALLAGGFAVCGLSTFVPVSRFGALAALAMFMALLADLVLVPAWLSRLRTAEGAQAGI